ncbi:MAG: hypothetical protein J6S14_21460 [Clostridia bacterium]|nr:hypothetical protein [Clostridia bacterium]
MHPLYDKFYKLCEELAIKNRIDPILATLYAKRDELQAVLNDLSTALQKEQRDVEKLEKLSISSVFYAAIGQKDKKLEKEKAEAFDAEGKYSDLQNELSKLNEEINQYECELRTVRGCDLRYGRLLPQILDEIKASDSSASRAALDTFDTLTRLEAKLAKLDEALEISREALKNAKEAGKYFSEADICAQSLKYSSKHPLYLNVDIKVHLSNAQPIVETLCRQIKRIDASLVGSHIDFETKIEVGNHPDDIAEWKTEIDRLIPQIEQVQEKLKPARERCAVRCAELRIELHEQIKAVLE